MKGQDFENIISQYVERIRKCREHFKCFWILINGKKIGTLHIQEIPSQVKGGNILDIHWIDIEKEHRGHKYATQVLEYLIESYKSRGFREFHLEVPGNAPDARHIYEKLGFIDTGKTREKNNKSWNGLTTMILKV
jgi:ribosomal protein S18 acetylase RimI-like enzyme